MADLADLESGEAAAANRDEPSMIIITINKVIYDRMNDCQALAVLSPSHPLLYKFGFDLPFIFV